VLYNVRGLAKLQWE